MSTSRPSARNLALAVPLLLCACGQTLGGVVMGPADTHCTQPDGGALVQETDPAACNTPATGAAPDYGAPLYNGEGNDDDCKYHAKLSTTAITKNQDVTLTVIGTLLAGGAAMTG